MYRWGLPLGCFFFAAALAGGIVALQWLIGTWLWVGAAVAGLCFYTAVICVHLFELSSCPIDEPPAGGGSVGC